jgi:hypothetical protein
MEAAKMVRIRTEQNMAGAYFDRIVVVIGDLHLRCDVNCDRDIRLAKQLADSHEAPFEYAPEVAERVLAALATAKVQQRFGSGVGITE